MNRNKLGFLTLIAIVVSGYAASGYAAEPLGRGDALSPETCQQLALNCSKDSNQLQVIDFFASWCVTCRREMPAILEITKQFSIEKRVRFIGVDIDLSANRAKKFSQEMHFSNYPAYHRIQDTSQRIISTFDPPSLPHVYLVQGGKVISQIRPKDGEIAQQIRHTLQRYIPEENS